MPLGKKKKGHLRNVLKTNSQLFSFSVQFCILALHLVLQWGECLLKKWSRHTCLICTSLCSWMIGPNRPSELFRKQHSAMCALPWLGELLLLFSRQVMSDSPWPHDSEFQASGSLTISQSLPGPSPSPRVCPSSCTLNVGDCITQWSYESCHARPPKTDRSEWRVLTKRDPLEERMANHSSILAVRTPWTALKKGKKAPRCRDLVRVCPVIPIDVKGLAVWKQLVTET